MQRWRLGRAGPGGQVVPDRPQAVVGDPFQVPWGAHAGLDLDDGDGDGGCGWPGGWQCQPLLGADASTFPLLVDLSVMTSAGVTLVAPIARSKNRRGAEAVVLSDHTIRLPLLSRSTGGRSKARSSVARPS